MRRYTPDLPLLSTEYRADLSPRSDLDCFTVDWVLTTRF